MSKIKITLADAKAELRDVATGPGGQHWGYGPAVMALLHSHDELLVILGEAIVALEEKDQKIEAMKVEAEGSNERTKLIFEAKKHWAERARVAEQRLQQPIKLSRRYETAGYCIAEHYCQEADDGDYLDRDELIASLLEQGFKVERE